MYIVLDLEFYHNRKKEVLGPIKQIGAFKFDEEYNVIDIFEMTVTHYTTQNMLRTLFLDFIDGVEDMYLWAKNNDLRALEQVFGDEIDYMDIIDVQSYFKDVNLASLSSISEALSFEPEGRHNALVDAEYTFEIIKHFNLNSKQSRTALGNYVKLIRTSEMGQKKTDDQESKQFKTNFEKKDEIKSKRCNNYDLIVPGTMRKLSDEYYQIVNEKAINQIVSEISSNEYAVMKDGEFKLSKGLEQLVSKKADIVFSDAERLKSIASKFEQKLIIIVDSSKDDNFLGIFVSKKAYKKFIK